MLNSIKVEKLKLLYSGIFDHNYFLNSIRKLRKEIKIPVNGYLGDKTATEKKIETANQKYLKWQEKDNDNLSKNSNKLHSFIDSIILNNRDLDTHYKDLLKELIVFGLGSINKRKEQNYYISSKNSLNKNHKSEVSINITGPLSAQELKDAYKLVVLHKPEWKTKNKDSDNLDLAIQIAKQHKKLGMKIESSNFDEPDYQYNWITLIEEIYKNKVTHENQDQLINDARTNLKRLKLRANDLLKHTTREFKTDL